MQLDCTYAEDNVRLDQSEACAASVSPVLSSLLNARRYGYGHHPAPKKRPSPVAQDAGDRHRQGLEKSPMGLVEDALRQVGKDLSSRRGSTGPMVTTPGGKPCRQFAGGLAGAMPHVPAGAIQEIYGEVANACAGALQVEGEQSIAIAELAAGHGDFALGYALFEECFMAAQWHDFTKKELFAAFQDEQDDASEARHWAYALRGRELLGLVSWVQALQPPAVFELRVVAVAKTSQNCGMGRALMTYVMKKVPPGGKIVLAVHRRNKAAQCLFTRLGFGFVDALTLGAAPFAMSWNAPGAPPSSLKMMLTQWCS